MSLKDMRIGFDLTNTTQNDAYSFLKKIDHKRGAFISYLVTEFLLNNYIGDFAQMTKEEAKIFATYILSEYANDTSEHTHANKINAMLNVLSRTPSSGLNRLPKSSLDVMNEPEVHQGSDSSISSNIKDTVAETMNVPLTSSSSPVDSFQHTPVTSYNDDVSEQNNLEVTDDFDMDDDIDDVEDDMQMNEAAFKAMMGLL